MCRAGLKFVKHCQSVPQFQESEYSGCVTCWFITWLNIFLFLKGNILRAYIYFFGEVQSKIRCQTYRNEMLNYGKHIWQFKIHYFFAVCLSEFLKEKTALRPLLQIALWDRIFWLYSPGNLLLFLLLEKLVLV